MHHNLQREGFGLRLRPVRMDDAPFIVWLRRLDHALGRVGNSATDTASQEAWLRAYFERQGDYYFILETTTSLPLGAYGIYDLKGASAESGRWVIRPGAPAAIPNAILAFELAFGALHLKELRASTVSTNTPVLSLNRKFGFRQTGITTAAQSIEGRSVDLIHFVLQGEHWPGIREKLLPLARLAGKQVETWEIALSQSSREPWSQVGAP
jgi:RimJ/RimL family protein N-acetyltransferase